MKTILALFSVEPTLINKYSNVTKRLICISLVSLTIYGCSPGKSVVYQQPPHHQPQTRTRSLESQHELAVMMRSWTQEQRDEFRRKYVYLEVNIFLKNGDTLTVK